MTDSFTRGWDGERHKGTRLGTLWFTQPEIDGDVTLSSAFNDLGSLARMDLLNDVIGLLEKERDATWLDFEKEYTK
jgi:hypothetical protein